MSYINFLGYRMDDSELEKYSDEYGQVDVDVLINERRRQKALVDTCTVEWVWDDTTMILTNIKKLMCEIARMKLKEELGYTPVLRNKHLYFDAVRPNEMFYLLALTSTPSAVYKCRVEMYTSGQIYADIFTQPHYDPE